MPNIPIQMLLRGRNTVGYTPHPTEVTDAFVREAATTGVDIFRIFDALNDVAQMRPAIDAVLATGTAVAEVAVCYTGDLLDPGRDALHARLLPAPRRADRRVPARTSSRSRTWRACCGRPRHPGSSRRCASASTCPSTCTRTTPRADSSRPCSPPVRRERMPSTRPPRRCRARRASRRCRRSSRRSRTPSATPASTSRPSATSSRTGRPCATCTARSSPDLPGPTGRVYHHEIPGGQLSNLRQQAIALGLADDFELIEDMYAAATASSAASRR